MIVETIPFDAADYIRSPEAQEELVNDAIESGDPGYVALALGVVARAHGMTQLARETGLTREGLYKALSPDGNPSFATVSKVARALGYRISLEHAP